MKCPECDTQMNLIETKSHYGLAVFLDQCLNCGSIWFDRYEHLTVKHGAAENVEAINERKLTESKILKRSELYCPRDGTKLELFRDINFPDQLKLENCNKCGGFWFNRGEFKEFQTIRKEKVDSNKELDKDLEKSIQGLLSAHSQSGSYKALARWGEALTVPISPIDYTTLPGWKNELTDKGVDGTRKTVAIITGIIYLLLRIFLKR